MKTRNKPISGYAIQPPECEGGGLFMWTFGRNRAKTICNFQSLVDEPCNRYDKEWWQEHRYYGYRVVRVKVQVLP